MFVVGDSLGLELIGMVGLLDNSPEKSRETWGYTHVPSTSPG